MIATKAVVGMETVTQPANGARQRIVDTHHHLWDLSKHQYPWLTDKIEPKPYGDYAEIRRDYLIEDFLRDVDGTGVGMSVHLNAGIARPDSLLETAWLQSIADDTARSRGFPHGIVCFANMQSETVEADLEKHCSYPNMRGVRQILSGVVTAGHADPSTSPTWHRNLQLLAKHGLSFDMQVHPTQMASVVLDVARAIGPTTLIIDHAGLVNYRDPEMLAVWRAGIRALAREPNVVMKISAFMIFDLGWTADSVRPFVAEMVDVFGMDRCFFGSNFPVDRLACSYGTLWGRFLAATSGYDADERDRLFFRNAASVYRLQPLA